MATNTKNLELLKHKSAEVSLGPDRAPARSMLRAVGLDDEDMEKPFTVSYTHLTLPTKRIV